MKILLVGEYSRLHNSLKEGLLKLGHEVHILGYGDGFKNFPVDFKLCESFNKGNKEKIKKLVHKVSKKDISIIDLKRQFLSYKEQLQDYDIVQFINECSFRTKPKLELFFFDFLREHNKKTFLLSCGTDYTSVQYALEKKFRYSILTPYFDGKVSKKQCVPALKYVTEPYQKLHEYFFKYSNGIIASDLDYHIPLKGKKNYLGMIPNAINTDILQPIALPSDDLITIFHGINSENYYKKGSDLFEEALTKVQQKFPNKICIKRVRSLPYNEYIKQYNDAHIILDQVYSYDQGYNALEAMAKGKVVFTGAEKEFNTYYNLKEDTVAINVEPNVDQIVKKLEWLIQHPEQIEIIGQNARDFIEKEHHYIKIAEKFLATWELN